MPLQVPCPTCSHIVRVPPMHYGRTLQCPACETQFQMPRTGPPKLKDKPDVASNQPTPPPVSAKPSGLPSPERNDEDSARDADDACGGRPIADDESGTDRRSSPPPLTGSRSRKKSGRIRRAPHAASSSAPAESTEQRRSEDSTKKVDSPTEQVGHSPAPPPLPPPKPYRPAAVAVDAKKPSKSKPKPDNAGPKPKEAKATGREPAHVTARTPSETESQLPDESPLAEDDMPTRGYEHNPEKRWTVYYLAIALAVAAIFGIVPAVLDVVQHFQSVHSTGISRWAWILLLLGGIQIGYAVFLFQLPDWASVWVVSIVTLGFATGYAMLLGMLLLADGQSQVIRFLQLTDRLTGHQATGWCLIMLSISILLAYFSGRIGTSWHRAYRLATGDRASKADECSVTARNSGSL